MGTEIVFPIALLVWVLSIVLISYRMIITKRKVAFWLALIGGVFGIIPLFLRLGADIFLILELEYLAAIGIGLIALVYLQRWQLASLYGGLVFFYILQKIAMNFPDIISRNVLFDFIALIGLLMAPVFIILTIVFCVGAFWEKRYLRT